MVKFTGFTRAVVKDSSTYPLVLANLVGLGLATFFGGRKLFQHPDITINPSEREAGYTTPGQLENAHNFRAHTAAYYPLLNPASKAIRSITNPGVKHDAIWDLDRIGKPLPPGREHTGAWDDGLFQGVPATPAPNELPVRKPAQIE